MRRNTRAFHDVFHTINTDTVLVPAWERVSYWAGEAAQFGLSVAHGGAQVLPPATLHVMLNGIEIARTETPGVDPHQVVAMRPVKAVIPNNREPRMSRLDFELRSRGNGALLATNYLPLAMYPARSPRAPLGQLAWSPSPDVRERMQALGYGTANRQEEAALIVATADEPWFAGYVRNGGRLIFLPEGESSLYPFFPHWQNVKVVARKGTPWRGDWASSFAWLRRRGPFASIPGGPLIDETFDRVIPTHLISGCNLLDFQARVHAGLAVGWVHKPVALVVERNYGRGRIVASTLRLLRDPPGEDPTATSLLEAMIKLAVAEQAPPAADPASVEAA
jgi:hypothetical protein